MTALSAQGTYEQGNSEITYGKTGAEPRVFPSGCGAGGGSCCGVSRDMHVFKCGLNTDFNNDACKGC